MQALARFVRRRPVAQRGGDVAVRACVWQKMKIAVDLVEFVRKGFDTSSPSAARGGALVQALAWAASGSAQMSNLMNLHVAQRPHFSRSVSP